MPALTGDSLSAAASAPRELASVSQDAALLSQPSTQLANLNTVLFPCDFTGASFENLSFLSLNGCVLGRSSSLHGVLRLLPQLEWLCLSGSSILLNVHDREFDEFLAFLGVGGEAPEDAPLPGVADSKLRVLEVSCTVAVFDDETLRVTQRHVQATTNMYGQTLALLDVSKEAAPLRDAVFAQYPSLQPDSREQTSEEHTSEGCERYNMPAMLTASEAATCLQHVVNSIGQLFSHQSPLIVGIRCGAALENTQALLQLGASPNTRDRANNSALSRACRGVPNATAVARLLLEYSAPTRLLQDAVLPDMRAALRPASVWDKNVRWDGPFRFALMRGDREITQLLIEHAARQTPHPAERWLQLSALSHGQRVDIIQKAVTEAGINLSEAFMPAQSVESVSAAAASAGAGTGSKAAGDVCVGFQLTAEATAMHQLSVQLQGLGPGMEQSPLHEAAHKGDVELVRSLLAAGFSLWPRDKFRQLPLHCVALASVSSPSRVLRLLQSREADADDSIHVLNELLGARVHIVRLMLCVGGKDMLTQTDMYSQRPCDILANAVIRGVNSLKSIAEGSQSKNRKPAKGKLSGKDATQQFKRCCSEGHVPPSLERLHEALLPQ